jgi:glycosyltransferase involved in cell wall biosynthesis/thymidylate kinase
MTAVLALEPARRRFAVVCFGLEAERARRQPWHVALGIAEGIARLGHDVALITDALNPPSGPCPVHRVERLFAAGRPAAGLAARLRALAPERVFLVAGALRVARLRGLDLGAPVSLVMASPRWRPAELLRLGPAALWRERALLALPLLESLLPGGLLRRGLGRAAVDDVVYLSDAARARYAACGLPRGRRLVPQVSPTPPTDRPDPVPTLAYLGPPLALRGADLAVAAFERAVAKGLRARLLLLLRADGDDGQARRLRARCRAGPCAHLIDCETRELSPEQVRRRIAAAHGFVLPFRVAVSEVPLALIEAGLTGRPVVVLDTPGITEYARALGAIVARDAADLPRALIAACGEGARRPADAEPWTRWDRAVAPLLEAPRRDGAGLALVALIGADGGGKTLLVQGLMRRLAAQGIAHRHVWSRFRNYLSKPILALARLTGHNRKEVVGGVRIGHHDFGRSPVLAAAFLATQLLDLWLDIKLRFRRGRGLVVADRCALDTLVDLAVATGREDLVIDRLALRVARWLPRRRLAVLVERSPALVAAQRPDALADPHHARRRLLYRRLADRLGLPVLRNDGAPETALAALERLIAGAGSLPRGPG